MSHSFATTPSSSGINCVQVLTTSDAPLSTSSNPNQIISSGTFNVQTGDIVTKEKKSKNQRGAIPRKPPPTIDNFWQNIMAEVRGIQVVDAKHQALPLARIKKIMKLDENAKMIAAEAPLLFAKACEYFIQELTMRAWVHTEESKRRTLQRSDIAQAIAGYDQFDFLIDIVPREDIKPSTSSGYKKESQQHHHNSASSTPSNASIVTAGTLTLPVKMESAGGEVLTFGTLTADALAQAAAAANQQQSTHASHQASIVNHPQQFQIIQQPSSTHPNQMNYFIAAQPQDPNSSSHGQNAAQPQQLQIIQQAAQPQYYITHQPQQLILTTGPNGQLTATPAPSNAAHQQATILQNLAQHQQQQQSQAHIQLLQQVVTPTGEVTNVPIAINANQLNLLRLQMQPGGAQQLLHLNTNTNAPVTTAHAVTAAQLQQAHPHLIQQQQHHQQANTGAANIFISATPHVTAAQVHNQQQQHQQQQQQQQQQQPQLINLSNASIVATDRTLGSNFRPNC